MLREYGGTPPAHCSPACGVCLMQLIPARSNGNATATISSRTNEAEIHRVSLRGRGKSSWNWPKHSINFGLRDAAQKPTRETLLGMPAAGDWLLQAPFGDQSLMRNALAYGLWRAMGYWAPRTRHVELFLIDDGASAASSVPCRPFFPATSAQDLIPPLPGAPPHLRRDLRCAQVPASLRRRLRFDGAD